LLSLKTAEQKLLQTADTEIVPQKTLESKDSWSFVGRFWL